MDDSKVRRLRNIELDSLLGYTLSLKTLKPCEIKLSCTNVISGLTGGCGVHATY
jgi:hypothetical protein